MCVDGARGRGRARANGARASEAARAREGARAGGVDGGGEGTDVRVVDERGERASGGGGAR